MHTHAAVSALRSGSHAPPAAPAMQRARGTVRIAVAAAGGGSARLVESYQSGAARVRYPRPRAGAPLEAVLVNTAGGLTGGDRLDHAVTVGAGARAVVTTQAAERIYRRADGIARIDTRLTVAAGASLAWLPQETILFDRSALTRTLAADIDPAARLIAVEALVLGRAAMGETAERIQLADSWRIRRGGRLVFADGARLDGDAADVMAGGATGRGAVALATVVLVAPDAGACLDRARAALADGRGEGGASAWNGILVGRLLAPSGQVLRADLVRLIEALAGAPMPRVWQC